MQALTTVPRCKKCGTALGEMRNGNLQLLICLGDHARSQLEKYERQGWAIPETPIATHRIFDRCLLDGPASRFENEVTCNACRGWGFTPIEEIPFIEGTRRRPSQELNQRLAVNIRNRIRRQAEVCGISNNKSVKTLCGRPLDNARQLVKADSFTLVTCPECWEHRPKVISEAEERLANGSK